MNMQSHHWVMLVVAFILGYVVHSFFPQPGASVGLKGGGQ